MKTENFCFEKGQIGKILHGVWTSVGNRGKSETGWKCIIASGEMDALHGNRYYLADKLMISALAKHTMNYIGLQHSLSVQLQKLQSIFHNIQFQS